jgi:isoleucyl-tRNA synthetase
MDNIVTEVVGDFVIARGDGIEVALCTKLDDELIMEGHSREMVSKTQQLRKSHKLAINDRIILYVNSTGAIHNAINRYYDYITSNTLTICISYYPMAGMYMKDAVINGEKATIGILPVNKF